MSLATRARVFAALGEPHRLAIVDALQLADRRSGELAAAVGLPTNLLAHHLAVLEAAGCIAAHRSAGDARARYWSLRRAAFEALWPPPALRARHVLFVCTRNAARSQLALALWRSLSPVPAESAGIDPAPRVHHLALRTAARHELDLTGATTHTLDDAAPADLVVTVCDRAHEALPPAVTGRALHWSVPDPVPHNRSAAFERAYAQLEPRVSGLAAAVARGGATGVTA